MLSVILPAYNEEKMIALAAETVSGILDGAGIGHELLFVDDGSRDGTWEAIRAAAGNDPSVRGLCFSRNFGKEAAILAGLEASAGECCAVMDCDLQHPPEKLPEMYRLWQEGWDAVNGVKADRGRESGLRRLAAGAFYGIMSRAAGCDMAGSSDFKLLDRKVVRVLVSLPEQGAFFRALAPWTGFRQTDTEYRVEERRAGKSHWSLPALARYAASGIAGFTAAPLQGVTVLGCAVLLADLVLGAASLADLVRGRGVEELRMLLLALLFLGGCLMLGMGVLGYYLSRVFAEVRHRPRYLIAGRCGEKEEDE
jgi:dolichol-phosphate mannosyltransferase